MSLENLRFAYAKTMTHVGCVSVLVDQGLVCLLPRMYTVKFLNFRTLTYITVNTLTMVEYL